MRAQEQHTTLQGIKDDKSLVKRTFNSMCRLFTEVYGHWRTRPLPPSAFIGLFRSRDQETAEEEESAAGRRVRK